MPTYEYKCKSCGNTFTEMLPISQRDNPVKCKCGKKAFKSISTVNLIGFDNVGRST